MFKIFNIGKANSRIAELEKQLADLQAAKPAEDLTALNEALASNVTISQSLEQAHADLVTAQASLKSLGDEKAKLALDLAASNLSLESSNTALSTACAELKIETKAEATALDKITALKNGVSTTLAKAGFPVAQVPAAPASKGDEKSTMTLAEFAVMTPAAKMGFIKAGGKLTD